MVIWQNNGGGSTCKCHIINSDGMDHIHSHCMVLNKYGITVMINDKKKVRKHLKVIYMYIVLV